MLKKTVIFFASIVTFFMSISAPNCQSQEVWTTWDSLNTGGALLFNTVYSIATDHNGNKWFGTRERFHEGIPSTVVKFDGQTWTNQHLDLSMGTAGNRDLDSRIWTIFVDSKNNIWAGTHGDGVFKFDGSNWTKLTTADGLGGNWVRDIVEDGDGNLWFACGPEVNTSPVGEGGLTKFDGTTFTTFLSDFSQGTFVGGKNSELADNYCYALTIDLQENLWIGTKGSGVSRLAPDGTFTLFWTADGTLMDDRINAGAADTDLNGNVWVGFQSDSNNGAAWFDGTKWERFLDLGDSRIREIVHDSHGNIWFGDKFINENGSLGLVQYDGTNIRLWRTNNSDIASNLINMIEIDEQKGEVWVATNRGISVLGGVIAPVTSVEESNTIVVEEYQLAQNYPNPFNPETVIEYTLESAQNIVLVVYNTSGQLIRTLVNEHKQPGIYSVRWNGKNDDGRLVSSGTYFYEIHNDQGHRLTKSLILLR
jgi:ligand-binding sensor domain-containing protein